MNAKTKDYLLVTIQLLLMLLILIVDQPSFSLMPVVIRYLGAGLIIFGILIGTKAVLQMNRHISALPTPKKGSLLLITGVYAFIRHPMYSALSMAGIGYSMFDSDFYKLLLSLLLLLFFEVKSQYEETRLIIFFPDYSDYKSRTGKFFPMIFYPKSKA